MLRKSRKGGFSNNVALEMMKIKAIILQWGRFKKELYRWTIFKYFFSL